MSSQLMGSMGGNVVKTSRLKRWFIRILMRIVNTQLGAGKKCIIQRDVSVQDESVSQSAVQEAVETWKVESAVALIALLSKLMNNRLTGMTHNVLLSSNRWPRVAIPRRILPTWHTIQRRIENVVLSHGHEISTCRNQSDLRMLLTSLQGEYLNLRIEIESSITLFQKYTKRVNQCIVFVGEARKLESHLKTFRMLPLPHATAFEDRLQETLVEIFETWDLFDTHGRSTHHLDAFFDRMKQYQSSLAVLSDQVFPVKCYGDSRYIESFLAGCSSKQQVVCSSNDPLM